MIGLALAEVGHFVNVIPPIDITGGKTGDVFHLKHHSHATIAVLIGVSAAAFTKILVNSVDNAAGDNAAAMAYSVYKEETAAGDTLGPRSAVAAAGLTPNAADNIMYIIEIDAADLPDGQDYVQVQLTNTTNSVIAAVLAILTGAKYGGPESATVLT